MTVEVIESVCVYPKHLTKLLKARVSKWQFQTQNLFLIDKVHPFSVDSLQFNIFLQSRSVSWNSSGIWLAIASSDRMARLWTLDGSVTREVLVVSGHTAPVQRVRFHPTDSAWLCTAASDGSVRLWDVRSATQKSLGRIDVQSGNSASDIAWNPNPRSASILAVTEGDGSVYLYDTRKLPSHHTAAVATNSNTATPTITNTSTTGKRPPNNALHTFQLQPSLVETCIFSPFGRHLVAATTNRNGLGELSIWNWEEEKSEIIVYPAHSGPIYSLAFSPDGARLASGGSDAIVGIWDTESVVCTHTIHRCTKFIRSVSFSHDSQLLASSSEDGITVSLADSGEELVEEKNLGGRPGADEISFHPKAHVIACARCDFGMGNPAAAVTIAKLSFTS